MYDLQVVYPQQIIDLTQVSELPGLPVRTLDLRGADFRAVESVSVNEQLSPSFAILSQYRLLAQVPPQLRLDRVTSITVLSNQLSLSPRSLLQFRLGLGPRRVTGMLRLVQLFLKVLLTTPGRDIFSPKLGGGALRDIGATFGESDGADIVSNLVVAVGTTSRQMIAIQTRNSSIPRTEKLLSATVQSSGYNANEGALLAQIELLNQAGQVGTANVTL